MTEKPAFFEITAMGAFVYGAVFYIGLMLSGNQTAFVCGLVGAGAAYLTQYIQCLGVVSDEPLFDWLFWAGFLIAVGFGLAGLCSVIF